MPALPDTLPDIQAEARELILARFSLVHLHATTRAAYQSNWPCLTVDADSFGGGTLDNIGIITGPRSAPQEYALVCVDLDSPEAVEAADGFLPPTDMIDGRPSKPRSHRCYHVALLSIPDDLVCQAGKATLARAYAIQHHGHPGPGKIAWKHSGSRRVDVELLGTGQQFACPPSRNGYEVREWHGGTRGDPAIIENYMDLIESIDSLAASVGASRVRVTSAMRRRPLPAEPAVAPSPAPAPAVAPAPIALRPPERWPHWEVRYRAYLRTIAAGGDLPRSGQGGDAATYRLLSQGMFQYGLPDDIVFRAFVEEINAPLQSLADAWDEIEIWRKIGIRRGEGPRDAYPLSPDDSVAPESSLQTPKAATNPDRLADSFLVSRHLMFRKKTIFQYSNHWRVVTTEDVAREIWAHVEREMVAEFHRAVASAAAERTLLDPNDKKALAKIDKATPKVAHPVSNSMVANVLSAVASKCALQIDPQPGFLLSTGQRWDAITLSNGILDLGTGELHAPTPDFFNLTFLSVAYDPAAEIPSMLLDCLETWTCGDQGVSDLLQEITGWCLDINSRIKAFVMLLGAGDNGKSAFLTMLRTLLDEERNCSAVDLGDLASKQFATFAMYGMLANIVGDQSYFDTACVSRLKALTGGDRVSYEEKGRTAISAVNTTKLIVAANEAPHMRDRTSAIWSRSITIAFDAIIQDKNPKLLDSATWTATLPGVLNWALAGLTRLRARTQFALPAQCAALREALRLSSDHAREFLLEAVEIGDVNDFIPADELWRRLDAWWSDQRLTNPPSKKKVAQSIDLVFPGHSSAAHRVGGIVTKVRRGLRWKTVSD